MGSAVVETCLKLIVLFSNTVLTLAFGSAWYIFGRNVTWGAASPVQVHLSIAGIGVLFSLFANLCIIFYFVGTGVWMRDKSRDVFTRNKDAGMRAWAAYEAANKLKGLAFPLPTMALVFGAFTFILGGANQVGALPTWIHPTVATILTLLSWGAVPMVFKGVQKNLVLLDQVSAEIDLTENAVASATTRN